MSLNARISQHMRSAVAAADRPVFVDSTGHRARLFRRTGYGLAALASTYVVVLGLSLLGATPFAPGVLLPVPGVPGVSGGPGAPAAPAAPAVPGPGALGQVPPLSGGAPGVGGRMAGDSGTVTSGPPGVFPPPVPGTSSFIGAPVPPATAGPAAPQGPPVPDAPHAPDASEAPVSPVPPPDPAPGAPSPVPAPDTGTPPGAPLPEPAPETPLPTPSAATPQAPSEGPPEGSSSVPPSGVPAAQAP
jgi:hypothetical protein